MALICQATARRRLPRMQQLLIHLRASLGDVQRCLCNRLFVKAALLSLLPRLLMEPRLSVSAFIGPHRPVNLPAFFPDVLWWWHLSLYSTAGTFIYLFIYLTRFHKDLWGAGLHAWRQPIGGRRLSSALCAPALLKPINWTQRPTTRQID